MSKNNSENPLCFIIMPISDIDSYDDGHFERVYNHLIKPSCTRAGFNVLRADDINFTHHIVLEILKKIVTADMVLCDLSGRNPNVLYELGIRQAFNKPVTIIKDELTPRIFDIQGIKDIEYDSTLRIDTVEDLIDEISATLKNNYQNKQGSINSLIELLGIKAAEISAQTEISNESKLILDSIGEIHKRLSSLEDDFRFNKFKYHNDNDISGQIDLDSDINLSVGDKIIHDVFGEGKIISMRNSKKSGLKATVFFKERGKKTLMLNHSKIKLAT